VRSESAAVDPPVELRKLRYLVAVGEELHFGRAAERLHMSQSPLSRAIRELERELGVVLFVRTTRRVELTPAGSALLVRARRALAEIDLAVDEARGTAEPKHGVVGIGYGPFSRPLAARIGEEFAVRHPELTVRLEEDVSPELLRRVAANELAMAAVFETPGAARRHGARIDTLRDEPLLAALPATHRYADADAIPIGDFAAECVLLPREPTGRGFNGWLRAVVRAAGFELERTRETLSAPWDRRMLPVADGEAVSAFVGDWAQEASPGVVAVPFDPPLTFPIDLATGGSPIDGTELLLEATLRLRDTEGWLTRRPARTQLPSD
jgi:DNA-binding transcriptional LysR family regulator